MNTEMKQKTKKMTITAALVAVSSLAALQTHAGLYKLDFGTPANDVTLTGWNTFPDWSFTDFPDGIATWALTDFSTDNNTNVTLTILDNTPLAAQLGAPARGMLGYNPDPQGLDVAYDGINVPAAVKDDYLFRDPDTAGTELLYRFANLTPGQYHVTVFEGRVSDPNGQYGKIWIDDADGKNEPVAQNTGDFSGNPLSNPNDPNSPRVPNLWGHPQTLVVDIKAGDYLWCAQMEDGLGGISGIILRSWVDSDGDGMPDDWEIKYGLNSHDPNDAAMDLNGNGLSNLLEYQAALDPADTISPTIRSAVANPVANEVVVTFSKPIFAGSGIANDPRDATTAQNLANYSISPALAIVGVVVKGNVVTLRTARPTPVLTAYTLTVNNVRDINNWPVPPNSTVTFSMGAAPPTAQPLVYRWITIAGKAGSTGVVDGTNNAARFNQPNGIGLDSAGNLYTADTFGYTIRKLTRMGTNWVTTTIAGLAGHAGSADGTNSAIRFGAGLGWPIVDVAGNVYVPDYGNQTIRKLTLVGADWVSSTIAGKAGSRGGTDGTNSIIRFSGPNDIALDPAGNLIVLEYDNHTIRKLTPDGTNWVASTIAGKAGVTGGADGTNDTIRFKQPAGLAMDPAGNIYVADQLNDTIRKLTPDGTNWVSSTIAGKVGIIGNANGTNNAARFVHPSGVALDSMGILYVSDTDSYTIRKLTPLGTNWVTSTIGGKASALGSADGTNSVARFTEVVGLKVDGAGNVYVADTGNSTIRMGVPLPAFQSVTSTSERVDLLLSAAPGQRLQLQYTSDLASATWTNLGNPITATDATVSATDKLGPDEVRFYRAIVVLP